MSSSHYQQHANGERQGVESEDQSANQSDSPRDDAHARYLTTGSGFEVVVFRHRSPAPSAWTSEPYLRDISPSGVHASRAYDFDFAGPTNPRRPQDFAQIRVASDKSRQALDFSAIPRGNRSWVAATGGKLQLVGGTRPGASWSLPVNLPPCCARSVG